MKEKKLEKRIGVNGNFKREAVKGSWINRGKGKRKK